MTTNGILLDRYFDFLVKHNFRLLVSLDGNYEASSYRVTASGRNVFHQIQKNLMLLKAKYQHILLIVYLLILFCMIETPFLIQYLILEEF